MPALGPTFAAVAQNTGFVPPPRCDYRGKSLRSGGISIGYSIVFQLDRIMALSRHTSEVTVRRHYLDASVELDANAQVFARHLRQSSLSLFLQFGEQNQYTSVPCDHSCIVLARD